MFSSTASFTGSSAGSSSEKEARSVLIQVQGRFNAEAAAKLQQQLALIDPERHSLWVLDLAQVKFIDSSGLGALVIGYKTAIKHQCRLVLCNLSPDVRMTLEISQLDRILEVVEGFTDLEPVQLQPEEILPLPLPDRVAA